jgi:hypothetical protein
MTDTQIAKIHYHVTLHYRIGVIKAIKILSLLSLKVKGQFEGNINRQAIIIKQTLKETSCVTNEQYRIFTQMHCVQLI